MSNNQLTELDILDKVLEPEFWDYMMERKHYTGHMYRNSPFESDDSCGNCDGARCDICKEIIEPADIECSIRSDKLEQFLIDAGAPKDVAQYFAYDDECKTIYNGYRFRFPTVKHLKAKYPDKYEELLKAALERDKKEKEEIQKRFSKTT